MGSRLLADMEVAASALAGSRLRRLGRVDQFNSVEVTHSENGIGSGSEIRGYHPRRRRVLEGVKRAGNIIHAEGVRGWCSIIRAKSAAWWGGLPIAGDPFEFAAYVLEVLRADASHSQKNTPSAWNNSP